MQSRHKVTAQLQELRKIIDDPGTDQVSTYIAQIAEEALQWASESNEKHRAPVDEVDKWYRKFEKLK